MLQTILIPKRYFSKQEAIDWIKHHYELKKIDETDKFYRFRQNKPDANLKFYSKILDNGVVLVHQY